MRDQSSFWILVLLVVAAAGFVRALRGPERISAAPNVVAGRHWG